jgi:hypothetical protein
MLLVCLTGCDALFRLSTVEAPPPVDASGNDGTPGNCFRDPFSAPDADLAMSWDRFADSTACKATVASGELVVAIDPNIDCYAGVESNVRPSFVGGSATVHVAEATASGNVETLFSLQIDSANAYYIDVGKGYLSFTARLAGVDMQHHELQYDPVAHAYWQLAYVADGPQIAFRTSPDGEAWVDRHSVTAVVPLMALASRLEAGTYGGGTATAQTARFDDFVRCLP